MYLSRHTIIALDITDPTPYEEYDDIVGVCDRTGKEIHDEDEVVFFSMPKDYKREYDKMILANEITEDEIELLEKVGFVVTVGYGYEAR